MTPPFNLIKNMIQDHVLEYFYPSFSQQS